MEGDILFCAVVEGDRDLLVATIHEALQEGVTPQTILQEGIINGMAEVGRLF